MTLNLGFNSCVGNTHIICSYLYSRCKVVPGLMIICIRRDCGIIMVRRSLSQRRIVWVYSSQPIKLFSPLSIPSHSIVLPLFPSLSLSRSFLSPSLFSTAPYGQPPPGYAPAYPQAPQAGQPPPQPQQIQGVFDQGARFKPGQSVSIPVSRTEYTCILIIIYH